MDDPFNKLPVDPEWIKRADALCEEAADKLGCAVVLCAVQEGGKIGVCFADNDPDDARRPFYKMIADNMPQFFLTLARYTAFTALRDKAPKKGAH